MTKRKSTMTATDILRAWWMDNPDGTHDLAVTYVRAHGFRNRNVAKLKKLSHQTKSLLNKKDGGPSQLTVARRNNTRNANAVAKQRRHPREHDDMVLLRTYWASNGHTKDGGRHDDAVRMCIDAGVSTSIARSYEAASKVRKERQAAVLAAAGVPPVPLLAVEPTLPVAKAPEAVAGRHPSVAGRPTEPLVTVGNQPPQVTIARRVARAKRMLDEAQKTDPVSAVLLVQRAITELRAADKLAAAALVEAGAFRHKANV